jgi:hypothetical protein
MRNDVGTKYKNDVWTRIDESDGVRSVVPVQHQLEKNANVSSRTLGPFGLKSFKIWGELETLESWTSSTFQSTKQRTYVRL